MNTCTLYLFTLACLVAAPDSPAISVSKTKLDFGTQEIFTESARQRLELRNVSTRSYEEIKGFNFSNVSFRRVITNCPRSLAPGQSCYWDVTYSPQNVTSDTGIISIWGSLGSASVNLIGKSMYPFVTGIGPKKWHPGHYAQMSQGDSTSTARIQKAVAPAEIKGALVQYEWAQLERSRGVFDFSKIERDLAFLKGQGKRLAIMLVDKGFGASDTECVPPDMKTNPLYQGGQILHRDSAGRITGCIAKRWVPAVMDRIIAIHRALGARFDNEPYVEAVTTEESATSIPSVANPGFDARGYVDQLKRLASAMAQAYPHTLAEIWVNWSTRPYTGELVDHLHRNGIAFGGPDVSPLHFTETITDFTKSTAYADKLPIMPAVQPTFLIWQDTPIKDGFITLDDVFHFAVIDPNGVNATHLWWWYFEDPKGTYDYYDTLDMIRKNKAYINTLCPESLECDTR